MDELKKRISELREKIAVVVEKLNLDEIHASIRLLEATAAKPNFWDDQRAALAHMRKLADFKLEVETAEDLTRQADDLAGDGDSASVELEL